MIVIERGNRCTDFSVKISQEVAKAIKVYCETIEMKSIQFIRDAIVEKLIHSYVDIESEDYILIGDRFPEVKKPLNDCLKTMKLAIEMKE